MTPRKEQIPANAGEPLMGIPALAEMLDVPVGTIRRWRRYGLGPSGFVIGKHVKYRLSEVEAWLEQQRDVA